MLVEASLSGYRESLGRHQPCHQSGSPTTPWIRCWILQGVRRPYQAEGGSSIWLQCGLAARTGSVALLALCHGAALLRPFLRPRHRAAVPGVAWHQGCAAHRSAGAESDQEGSDARLRAASPQMDVSLFPSSGTKVLTDATLLLHV